MGFAPDVMNIKEIQPRMNHAHAFAMVTNDTIHVTHAVQFFCYQTKE